MHHYPSVIMEISGDLLGVLEQQLPFLQKIQKSLKGEGKIFILIHERVHAFEQFW